MAESGLGGEFSGAPLAEFTYGDVLMASATEYRNLPLSILTKSKTNSRRIFEDAALKELADSIRNQGVFSPLLVRPLNERSFEIVAGARRFRAAQMAEAVLRLAKIQPAEQERALAACFREESG